MTISPPALWLIAASIGYLVTGTWTWAAIGAVCAMAFSLMVSVLDALIEE